MNRIFEIAIFALVVLSFQNLKAQQTADIQFVKLDHNFGKINEEAGIAVFDFNFTNTGKVPLILQGVEASCGCTTPEWSQEPVLPGKRGFIKVSYNPEQRPGTFVKSITVTANVPKITRVLTISGEVIPKPLSVNELYPFDFGWIRLSSGESSFVRIKNHEIKSDTILVYNPGDSPVSVDFKIIPPYLKIRKIPQVLQPKAKGILVITFDATKKPEYGFSANRIYMSYNGEEKYNDAIRVSATIEEDFSKLSPAELENAPIIEYNSRVFDFKEIAEGETADYTFIVMNKGKRDLIIRSVTASCGCTTGKPSSNVIAPGSSTELKVSFDSHEKVGMQNKIITVISNDPAHSTTLLRVIGIVNR